jgi:hypothetical protein
MFFLTTFLYSLFVILPMSFTVESIDRFTVVVFLYEFNEMSPIFKRDFERFLKISNG